MRTVKLLALVVVCAAGLALISPALTAASAQDPQNAQRKEAKREVIDPVCSMKVDPKTAEKFVYKGKTYYFCSKADKETFEKSPEKYVKAPGKAE